ncbi:hypothetical protein PJ985_11080 [Streptomyces sp. ACA25]|uniref:hypothetical protein n=1 Tax=Streptomyces sp. ACA25 TaxID=3022596 RepID=UPI0023077A44|nr:hypothetical protein [Streptomyces sp. ACA25]MDB1088108.1 hypothetical protein [Streptomyces sp. ACA25]
MLPHSPAEVTVTHAMATSAEAAIELHAALSGIGVRLPSLGVDLASCSEHPGSRPLVELGGCDADTARTLAAALRRAVNR